MGGLFWSGLRVGNVILLWELACSFLLFIFAYTLFFRGDEGGRVIILLSVVCQFI